MTFCPICKKFLCNHTPEERGQTDEQVTKPLLAEELLHLRSTLNKKTSETA